MVIIEHWSNDSQDGYTCRWTQIRGRVFLFPEKPLKELIDLAHEHDVYVSTVSADEIDGKMDD
jgi:hypothetical protein